LINPLSARREFSVFERGENLLQNGVLYFKIVKNFTETLISVFLRDGEALPPQIEILDNFFTTKTKTWPSLKSIFLSFLPENETSQIISFFVISPLEVLPNENISNPITKVLTSAKIPHNGVFEAL